MGRRTSSLGALLALAALAVFGPLLVYERAEAAEDGQQLPDQSTPSPEVRAPRAASAEPRAERTEKLRLGEPGSGEPGPLSKVQKKAMSRGPLVPDEAAYERLKAQANEKARQLSGEDIR